MNTESNFPVYPGWETVRLIGHGSFGAVYEIQRTLFGKVEKAALKQISIPQDQGDVEELYSTGYDDASITAHYESYLADIVREYQLMAEMKGHTNVVNCDDIRYVQKDTGIGWDIYIKMELLTPMMKSLDRMADEKQVIKLGRDMASALVLCRNRSIIHRDIKPQNIFVSKDGDFKLGDFGIAKTVEKTSGGTKIGTYNYMAPEVYNNQPYGHEADIYSLGMVMYWLLNNRRLPFYPAPPAIPLSSDMDRARIRRFQGEEIPAPAKGGEELKRIVLKCCAFDPKDRYHSAEELLRDLQALEFMAAQPKTEPAEQTAGGGAAEQQSQVDAGDETIDKNRAFLAGGAAASAAGAGVLLGSLSKKVQASGGGEASWSTGLAAPEDDGGTIGIGYGAPEHEGNAQAEGFSTGVTPVDGPEEESTVGVYGKASPETGKKKAKKEKPEKKAKKEKPEKKAKRETAFEEGKAKPEKKKKTGLIAAVLAALLCAAGAVVYFLYPKYGAWSEWSTVKPDAIEGRRIETSTQYRYREQTLHATTNRREVVGPVNHETVELAAWGKWSDWQETPIDAGENREVETGLQYRVRNKLRTTSEEAELEGWTLDGTRTVETKRNWTLWSTEQPGYKEGRATSSKTQYRAYWKVYRNNSVYRSRQYPTSSSDWRFSQDYGSSGSLYKSSKSGSYTYRYYTYYDTRTVYSYQDIEKKTVNVFYRWDDWGNWRNTAVEETENKQVETRTVYRSRDKVEATVYYYYDWSDWSDWLLGERSPSDSVELETRTVYRYADRD